MCAEADVARWRGQCSFDTNVKLIQSLGGWAIRVKGRAQDRGVEPMSGRFRPKLARVRPTRGDVVAPDYTIWYSAMRGGGTMVVQGRLPTKASPSSIGLRESRNHRKHDTTERWCPTLGGCLIAYLGEPVRSVPLWSLLALRTRRMSFLMLVDILVAEKSARQQLCSSRQ